jgi:hypothetical protein
VEEATAHAAESTPLKAAANPRRPPTVRAMTARFEEGREG